MNIFAQFRSSGVIPVIEIDDAKHILPLVEALSAGGLALAEITLRTPAALEAIRRLAREKGDFLVGAGTILNQPQAQAAVDAGAKFLVSPGLPEDATLWAQKNSIPILPGAITPNEIMRAINLGIDIIKFFPSETMGGLKAIKAMSDPFPGIKFIPTGGIRPDNLSEYLQNDKIQAVGGSWMCKRAMLAAGQFAEVETLARQAAQIVKNIRHQENL